MRALGLELLFGVQHMFMGSQKPDKGGWGWYCIGNSPPESVLYLIEQLLTLVAGGARSSSNLRHLKISPKRKAVLLESLSCWCSHTSILETHSGHASHANYECVYNPTAE